MLEARQALPQGAQKAPPVVMIRAQFDKRHHQFSQSKPTLEVDLELAGRRLRWRAHDAQLGQTLLRPLAHLVNPHPAGREVDLEIEILSQAPRAEIDSVHFELSPERDYAFQVLPKSSSLWRRHPATIVAQYQPLETLSLYELGRPLHAMLSLWLNQIGCPLVHAGLVEWNRRGILVGGEAGAGKTTTCLACLEAGQGFLGDDQVALDPQLWGHSLYATTFLPPERSRELRFLGEDWLTPRYPWEEKSLTYLWPQWQAQLRQRVAVEAVVLPGPSVEPMALTASQALLRLAPSSLLVGVLSAGQSGLDRLTELVRRVPCWGLPWQGSICDRLEAIGPIRGSRCAEPNKA